MAGLDPPHPPLDRGGAEGAGHREGPAFPASERPDFLPPCQGGAGGGPNPPKASLNSWRLFLTFAAIWLLLVVAGRTKFFQDPGTFWHVAVGERIARMGFFDTDPYTFTRNGAEWIPHQWLGEVAMAGAYRLGGMDLLLVLAAGILAAVFTVLGTRLMAVGLHPAAVAALLAVALACSAGHFHVRPHLGTIAGFAILLCVTSAVEHRRRPVKFLWWLVPLCWAWSNVHGGVLGGIATLAVILGGWAAGYFIAHGPFQNRRDIGHAAAVFAACVGVCFLTPYGWKLPASWLQIYRMESLPTIIQEHRPLNFSTFGWQGVAAMGAVYLFAVASIPVRHWRMSYVVPLIWLLLTFTRVRHAPLFAVAAMVSLADLFPHTRLAAWLVRKNSDWYTPAEQPVAGASRGNWLAPVVLLLLASTATMAVRPADRLHPAWVKLDDRLWPLDNMPILHALAEESPHRPRVFAEYHYGGPLIQHEPRCLVFIDDRCEVFGDQFLVDFVRTEARIRAGELPDPGKPLDDWQKQYDPFDLGLVSTGGGFDTMFASRPAEWKLVRRDDTSSLYARIK